MAVLDGDANDNILVGGEEADTLAGAGGNDSLSGGGNDDVIHGDDGRDTLYGGDGSDVIIGGYGRDIMFGGAGNDSFETTYDNDVVYGGSGDDVVAIYSDTGPATYRLYGGRGNDLVYISALASGVLDGGSDPQGGNSSKEDDLLSLYLYNSVSPTAATFTPNQLNYGAQRLDITGFERFDIVATSLDDSLITGDGDDNIAALGGSNFVMAGGGNDLVGVSLGGDNTVEGGDGRDRLVLAQQNLTRDAVLRLDLTGAVVTDAQGSHYTGFEDFTVYGVQANDHLQFGAGDDVLFAAAGNDTAYGGVGNDTLSGEFGNDRLIGNDGDDRLFGGRNSDTLYGGSGRDRLSGQRETDHLYGGSGQDVLIAFGDGDMLTGGADRDTFVLVRHFDGDDHITDWQQGVDRLRVSVDLVDGLPPVGEGVVISSDTAIGGQAQFVLRLETDNTVLIFDSNGDADGGETRLLMLYGLHTLTADDIVVF